MALLDDLVQQYAKTDLATIFQEVDNTSQKSVNASQTFLPIILVI
jgi:hypothetical protein